MVAVSISGCAGGVGADVDVAGSPPPPPLQPANNANPISATMFLVMCPPRSAGVATNREGHWGLAGEAHYRGEAKEGAIVP